MPTQITIDHVSEHGSRHSSLSTDEGSGVHVSAHSGSGSAGGYPLSEHSTGGPWEPLSYPDELQPEDSASRPPRSASSHHQVEITTHPPPARGRSTRHRGGVDREGVEYRHRITHPGSPESVDSGEDFVGHYPRPGVPPHRHPSYNYGYPPSNTEAYAPYPPVPSTQMIQAVPPHQPYGYSLYQQGPQHPSYYAAPSVSAGNTYANHFSPPPSMSYTASGFFPPYAPPYTLPQSPFYGHYAPGTASPKISTPPASDSAEDVKKLKELLEKQSLMSQEAWEKHKAFLEERDKAKEAEMKRIADEKAAAEARAASDKKIQEEATAAAEAKAAKLLAEAEAKTAKQLADAEAKAAEDLKKAEAEAAEKLKKQKEEAEAEIKKQKEEAEAETAKKVEEAKVKPPPEKKAPIKFKDAIGRKYQFPFEMCCKWNNMEELIRQAFMHVEGLAQHVYDGHYDLSGPTGDIILRDCWESTVEPDWTITMHMWPVPEPPPAEDLDAMMDDILAGSAGPKPAKKPGKKGAKISVVPEKKKKGASRGHGMIPPPPPPAPSAHHQMDFDDAALFAEVPHIIEVPGPDERPKKTGKRPPSGLFSTWMSGGRSVPSKSKKK